MKMKCITLVIAPLLLQLAGCGQPGPLYLPKDAPSVYDAPKPAEAEVDKNDENKAPSSTEQNPGQPDNKQ